MTKYYNKYTGVEIKSLNGELVWKEQPNSEFTTFMLHDLGFIISLINQESSNFHLKFIDH